MDKRSEAIKSIVTPIEIELLEVLNMSSEISDRFNDISNNIKQLSNVVSILGSKKTGAAMGLFGEVVNMFGEIKADDERERALRKVLIKKIELANLKLGVVTNFRNDLSNKIDPLFRLLEEEINRPYDENRREEFSQLHGTTCLDAFDLYVSTFYLIQVCDFMIGEFNAWIKYKHNSEFEVPDKSYILDFVLNKMIFPNGLKNGLENRNSFAGIWLLPKRESIIAGSMYKKFIEGKKIEDNKEKGFYSGSYKKKKILKRESFIYLKEYINETDKIVEQDKTDHLKIITDSIIYKQAKDVCNIKSSFFYFFRAAFIVIFGFYIISAGTSEEPFFSGLISGLIGSLSVAFAFGLLGRFLIWADNVKSDGGCLESLFKLIVGVLSLGTIPLMVRSYKNKEINFNKYIVNLKKECL